MFKTLCLPALLTAFFAGMTCAHAQSSFTWTGGGTDGNWTTAANWGGTAPGSPQANLNFTNTATRLTNTNNFAAGSAGYRIFFTNNAGAYALSGNGIKFFDFGGNQPKIENWSATAQTVNFAITNANTFGTTPPLEINPINGNLTINGAVSQLGSTNQIQVWGNNGKTLTFGTASVIAGAGSFAINQNNTVVFQSAHTYSGDTFVNAGLLQINSGGSANSSIIRLGDISGSAPATLSLGAAGALLNSTVVIRPGSGGTKMFSALNTTGSATNVGGIFLDAGLVLTNATGGTLLLSGGIDLKAQTLSVTNDGTVTISGSISNSTGSSAITKGGAGVLALQGTNNTFSGPITINAGILSLNVSNINGTFQPANGNASSITLAAGTTLRSANDGTVVTAPISVSAGASPVIINTPQNSPGGGFNTFLYISSVISGAGNVTFNDNINQNGLFTVQLNRTNTYAGNTLLDNSAGTDGQIIVRLGTNNALPTTTVVTLDGQTGNGSGRFTEINLNGWNQTLSGLTNVFRSLRVQRVVNSDVAAAATLTISNVTDYTFSGELGGVGGSVSSTAIPGSTHGNNFGLTKNGSAKFILNPRATNNANVLYQNSYAGATTVNGGVLEITGAGQLGNGNYSGSISIASGAALVFSGTNSNTLGGSISGAGVLTNSGTGALTISGTLNAASVLTAGKTFVTATQTGTGNTTVAGGTLVVTASGVSQWSPGTLTLTSGTLEFSNVQSATTAPISPGSATATAINIKIDNLVGAATAGNSYPLLANQGGTTSGYTLTSQPAGVVGHLGVSGTTLVYILDTVSDIWAGTAAANPSFWDVATTTNWAGYAANNTPANTYTNSDVVLFDDTATATNVSIQAAVTPSAVSFNNTTKNYTVTNSVGNVIGGSGSLSKSGSGSLTLVGGAAHTYSGPTVISAGTLQLGNGTTGNDASLSGTSAVTNNGTLIFNRFGSDTASYPISGSGAVTKSGAGTQTLSASNTYAGATTISAGTLKLGASNVIPDGAGVGNVTATGTLDLNSFSETINGLSGAGVVDTISGGTPTLTVGANDQTSTFSGIITNTTGTLALTKTGTGTLSLTGSNGFTGALNVNGGSLTIAGTGYPALGGNSPGVNGPASLTMASGTTLNFSQVGATGPANYYQPITLNTATLNTSGGSGSAQLTLNLNGGVTLGGNSTIHPNGNSALVIPSTTTVNLNSSTLTIQTDGSLTSTIGAVISGAGGSLTKSSGSTLTLSGANTFSGTLTLSSGTLNLNNTNAFTSAVVNSGTLSLGNLQAFSGTTNINLGTATLVSTLDTLTIGAPITLTGNPTINFGRSSASAGTFTLNGAIGGTGNITFHSGTGNSGGNSEVTLLGAVSTFAGNVTVTCANVNNSETLRNGVANALPVTTLLTIDGGAATGSGGRTASYDLNGFNQTLSGITNTLAPLAVSRFQRITSSSGSPMLTISNNNDCAFGGPGTSTNNGSGTVTGNAAISGSLSLTKTAAGTLTLGGPNSYTGRTIINNGTLLLSGTIANTPSISVGGGATFSASAGSFTLGASQTLSNNATATGTLVGPMNGASGKISVSYTNGTPAFNVAGGALTISNSTSVTVDIGSSTLDLSTPYKIISQSGSGVVTGAVPALVTLLNAPANTIGSLSISNSELYLTLTGLSTISYTGTGPFTYDGTAHGPTANFTGSTGAQTSQFVGVSVSYGPNANAPTNAGTYYLTNTVAADANYLGTNTSQVFTINPLPIAVTANATNKIYGAADPAFTYGFTPALIGADIFSGGLSRTTGETLGSYAINQGTLSLSPNYILNYTGANLTINPASLSITASNLSKNYGQSLNFAGTEFSSSGLVFSDVVTGVTLTSAGATNTATPGSYSIVPSAASGSGLTNYSITYNNGTLTVNPATLLVTADNTNRIYGTANPAFTASYSGFVNGETLGSSDVGGSPALTTAADTNSPAGTYDIVAALGSLTSTNYSFTFSNGTLTVVSAATTLALSSSSNPSGYLDTLTFIANVSPTNASGSVTFYNGATPFSTNSLAAGVATSGGLSTLPRGTNTITAIYGGDMTYPGSTNTLDQIVTNHPPTVNAASYTRSAAVNTYKIPITNLLANASDVDGDSLTLVTIGATTNSALAMVAGGYVLYYNTNAVADEFTYTVKDGFGGTNSATVTIDVSTAPLFGQSQIVSTGGGTATLSFAGIPGYSYSVSRSTNLVDWASIWTTNAPASGVFEFIDSSAPMPSAYYRLQYNP